MSLQGRTVGGVYRYVYLNLDGQVVLPGECTCDRDGAENCVIDDHKIVARQRQVLQGERSEA